MSITDYVIQTAYELEESERYQRKKGLYTIFWKIPIQYSPYFDIFMMLMVISSVFVLLFSVKHHLGAWAGWFENAVLVFLFWNTWGGCGCMTMFTRSCWKNTKK